MFENKLLEVKNLKTHFYSDEGVSKAVDGVDFTLHNGETLGLVGESGCGKSMTSLSIMRLIDSPPGKIVDGEVLLDGDNLLEKSEEEMRKMRGNDISMIFQEPMTSLNPVLTVGEQVAEAFRVHRKLNKKEAWKKAVEMLDLVGIPSPAERAKQEPHQLSGGMRQRVMIAIALSCNPKVLIADEPTTALDVTIQAQILDLIKNLQNELNMGIIMITHDLGVVSEVCDRVAVMYAGKVVEYSEVDELFSEPLHPYTVGLINSIPRVDMNQETLEAIPGNVPGRYDERKGCTFASRCEFARDICRQQTPELQTFDSGRKVRCWKYTDMWSDNPEVRNNEEVLAK